MDFEHSPKVIEARDRLRAFMDAYVYPREAEHDDFVNDPANLWRQPPMIEELKAQARAESLWNWFLPPEYGEYSGGFHNLEFAPLAEEMGRLPWSFEIFNCSAPDRGNMEVLARYGTPEQQDRWLRPLLEGRIRSCYAMTEPQVASSDATNITLTIRRDGDHYVLDGRKWYASNIFHPLCEVLLVMGVSSPDGLRHQRHSTILVPKDTPGLEIVRPMQAFGDFDSPGGHGELAFHGVRVPIDNMILGEGRGFEIAQGRLGPGRFQYAMTNVGMAQRCLELMCARAEERVAFARS